MEPKPERNPAHYVAEFSALYSCFEKIRRARHRMPLGVTLKLRQRISKCRGGSGGRHADRGAAIIAASVFGEQIVRLSGRMHASTNLGLRSPMAYAARSAIARVTDRD